MKSVDVLDRITSRVREAPQVLVFPEGEDARILQAAARLREQQLARPLVLGDEGRIKVAAKSVDLNLVFELVDPSESPRLREYGDLYYEKCRARGITLEEARQRVLDPLYFGALMVAAGDCGGCVAGACYSTADTVRAALRCIGLGQGVSILSSFFLMLLENPDWGEKGALIYADCAVGSRAYLVAAGRDRPAGCRERSHFPGGTAPSRFAVFLHPGERFTRSDEKSCRGLSNP